ncbi:PQQ-binding-like beta-propeller repeat protein [Nonomuraea sp. JJY05]|uniref:PQQ-like beta-propeller repeat protein n=1 Tax=Nonomuraea sp. JJY05 TaxID=3350255 RepID=UPI00373FBE80
MSRRSFVARVSLLPFCATVITTYAITGDTARPGTPHCPSWPQPVRQATPSRWPLRLPGKSHSLVLLDNWLYGAGDDRTAWLRESRNGHLVWRKTVKFTPFSPNISESSRIIVESRQVFIGGQTKDQGDELTALCAADGRHMWQHTFPEGGLAAVPLPDGILAVTNTAVYGMSKLTGEVRWQTKINGSGQSSALRLGDTLLIANTHSGVVALDARTGQVRWSTNFPGADQLALKTSGDSVHMIAHRSVEKTIHKKGVGTARVFEPVNTEVRTVSATTGHTRWSRFLPPLGSTALAAEGLLYVPAEHRLLALNSDTGKMVWSTPLPQKNLSPELHLHDGFLLVNPTVSDDTGLYPLGAFDPQTGKRRWLTGLKMPYSVGTGTPGMALTHGIELTAIATDAGEVIWSTPVPKDSNLLVGRELAYIYDVYTAQLNAYDIGTGTELVV